MYRGTLVFQNVPRYFGVSKCTAVFWFFKITAVPLQKKLTEKCLKHFILTAVHFEMYRGTLVFQNLPRYFGVLKCTAVLWYFRITAVPLQKNLKNI